MKIFKYIDGKLVELLEKDNKKRVNSFTGELMDKRYRCVLDIGYIEFTEEEEKQRDLEEYKDNQERPTREAKVKMEKKIRSIL